MNDPLEFQQTTINGSRLVARRFVLEAITKAHLELVSLKIGANGKLGFVSAPPRTASWRSEALQAELVKEGSSKTMWSNHRRGTAIDCFANWNYINTIKPTMNKYGLFNDLAYANKAFTVIDDSYDAITNIPWDGGHWNWKSNVEAQHAGDIVNALPTTLKEFSMDQYDGQIMFNAEGHGEFAGVYGGKKHIITEDRAGLAAIHPLLGGKRGVSVPLTVWNSYPTGDNF